MHIHSPTPQQSRVKLLNVVGCEDENPLTPAAGPQAISKIQQARQRDRVPTLLAAAAAAAASAHLRIIVTPGSRNRSVVVVVIVVGPVGEVDGAINILDDYDGFGAGFHEKLPEFGVVVDLGQLQIVNIIAEVIGHSSNHAGFTSPGRAIEKVTPFPGPSSFMVKRLSVGEVLKIVHDLLLLVGVHGQCVKGAGMLEGDRFPRVAPGIQGPPSRVRVQETVLILPPNVAGFLHNVIQYEGFVPLLDSEREPTLLVGEWAPRESLCLPLRHHVLPQHAHAVEAVHDAVIVRESEGEPARVHGACQAQPVPSNGHRRAQVQLDRVVQLVRVHAVDLRYVEEAVRGEAVEDPVEELGGSVPELWGEYYLKDGLAEGKHSQK
ncbi:hypothetical protein CR513_06367, partial [Mucuna pruriens]